MPTDPRDFVPPKDEPERLKANPFRDWMARAEAREARPSILPVTADALRSRGFPVNTCDRNAANRSWDVTMLDGTKIVVTDNICEETDVIDIAHWLKARGYEGDAA